MYKNCIVCKEPYSKPYRMGAGAWAKRKYCSHKCYWENKHDTPWNKGKNASIDPRILSNERANGWKGENVSYIGLHLWINRKLGKVDRCEHCGETTGRFEWANKSREYHRSLEDWIGLCYSCHEKYDQTWVNRGRDNL